MGFEHGKFNPVITGTEPFTHGIASGTDAPSVMTKYVFFPSLRLVNGTVSRFDKFHTVCQACMTQWHWQLTGLEN